MKIVIAGGNGFLGQSLTKFFSKKGAKVLILTRSPKAQNHIKWNSKELGDWQNSLEGSDVLINMVGKSVDCRYTEANKKEILNSRIESTQVLQKAIDNCEKPPSVWLNASSATIYDHSEFDLMTEARGIIGDDFSMKVCKAWEKEFYAGGRVKTRKVALRTSIVMGKDGGAFPKLKTVTKLGLGGKQGNGNQKVSWIHIEDFCRVVEFIIHNTALKGSINITAPNPISNAEFMRILRKAYKIPFGLPSPELILEIASFFLRTETELLLKSRNVYPEQLLQNGFQFKYENFEEAVGGLNSKG